MQEQKTENEDSKLRIKISDKDKEILFKYIPKNEMIEYIEKPINVDSFNDFLERLDNEVRYLLTPNYEGTHESVELMLVRDRIFELNDGEWE